ncbi:MAG TPA: helix-turn-helix domain-containing protein [Acidimicrobiales bacterium]|nr:helix-turn-helix domain-containing protein [Acidimicrobiales bacterium]
MTLPRADAEPDALRARALASRSRRELLAILQERPAAVVALAAATGLHVNAIRQHLAVLESAALVVREPSPPRDEPGRRGNLYRAVEASPPVNPFERIAGMLSRVADGASIDEVAADEGARLADAHAASSAVDAVAAAAGGLGFNVRRRPRRGATAIELHDCPFAAVAGPTVCGLHRAAVEHLAARLAARAEDFRVVDPRRGPCSVSITPLGGTS